MPSTRPFERNSPPRIGWFLSLPVVAYADRVRTALVRAPLAVRCGRLGVTAGPRFMELRDVENLLRPWMAPVAPSHEPNGELAKCRLAEVDETGACWLISIRIEDRVARQALRARRLKTMVLRGTGTLSPMTAKANFNPLEPRDERGRWTLEGARADGSVNNAPPHQATLAQFATQPPPTTMPTPAPGGIQVPKPLSAEQLRNLAEALRNLFDRPQINQSQHEEIPNPYPKDAECREEYKAANKRCRWLYEKRHSMSVDKLKGQSFEACVYGQVVDRCLPVKSRSWSN